MPCEVGSAVNREPRVDAELCRHLNRSFSFSERRAISCASALTSRARSIVARQEGSAFGVGMIISVRSGRANGSSSRTRDKCPDVGYN